MFQYEKLSRNIEAKIKALEDSSEILIRHLMPP